MTTKKQPLPIGQALIFLWALMTLAAAFVLICSGGLVTSNEAGMSVPDWPNTYGYNMFLFPISRWVGAVFYEHSHRLIASGVGMMTMVLTGWLLVVERRRWVKILGVAALIAVCIQGVLGGFRVTLNMPGLGIFHAMLAQAFFCALAILALAESPHFLSGKWDVFAPDESLRKLVLALTLLIFIQLGIAATMRHEHAGLSIPDFPPAYGRLLPDTSEPMLASINMLRKSNGQAPVTPSQIWLQMAHRFVAVLILAGIAATVWRSWGCSHHRSVGLWCRVWLTLILIQIALGAWVIWSNKAADVATSHVSVGALALLLGVLFTFRLFRGGHPGRFAIPDPTTPNLASHLA